MIPWWACVIAGVVGLVVGYGLAAWQVARDDDLRAMRAREWRGDDGKSS